MVTKMTDEQRRAIRQQHGGPVYVLDEETQSRWVLLPADDYDALRDMDPNEQFDISEMYPLVDEALREVWDDPAMDIYNDYNNVEDR